MLVTIACKKYCKCRSVAAASMSWKNPPPGPAAAPPLKKPRNEKSWQQLAAVSSTSCASSDWKNLELCARNVSWQSPADSTWKQVPLTEDVATSSSSSRCTKHEICIDDATLSFLVPPGSVVHNKFGKQAVDLNRIRALMEKETCSCTAGCLKLFTNEQVLAIRQLWHSLDMDGQQNYLQCQWLSSQVHADKAVLNEDQVVHRTSWKVYGHPVCFSAVALLLASSRKTLLKRISAQPDLRRDVGRQGKLPTRLPVQRSLVDFFFAELYHSTAERLPEQYHTAGLDEDPELQMVMGDPDLETFSWSPENCLLDSFTAPGLDPKTPKRLLPPGSLMLLYWQFKAWHAAAVSLEGLAQKTCPSWPTFYRTFQERWSSALGFRKVSQHKDCPYCFTCREQLAGKTLDKVAKMNVARNWQEHLRAQYADKLLYWGLRLASRQQAGMLCLICDAMDRGKTIFPKYSFSSSKLPPGLQQLHRPQLTLTAVIAHGWATCFFLADQYLSHGADASCEAIARTLDVCHQLALSRGIELPRHILLQADNTVAQSKNALNSLFAAYLTGTGRASSFTICHMTPGHTKEDIDRLFSVVLSKVIRPKSWETPRQFAQLLESEMKPFIEKRREQIHVHRLSQIHDFNQWLVAPTGIKLSGSYAPSRDGAQPACSFAFKVRADLSLADQARVVGDTGQFEKDANDVFVLLKGRMHHTSTQAPVKVFPHVLLRDLPRAPSRLVARHVISNEERANYEKLIARLAALPNPMPDAVLALEELLQAQNAPQQALAFPFLLANAPPRQRIRHTRNEYYEHLPDVSKRLVAAFRRN